MLRQIARYIGLFIIFTLVSAFGAYITIHLLFQRQELVKVPDLVTKDAVFALRVLSDAGLNIKVKEWSYHPHIPRDHIISQDPSAGEELKKKRDVKIIISLGPERLMVPDLQGLSYKQAGFILEANSLLFEGVFVHSMDWGEGVVFSQSPLPSRSVKVGSVVTLLVSKGGKKDAYVMPDLLILRLEEAAGPIKKMGLTLGKMEYDYDPSLSEEIILKQIPPRGSMVVSGREVVLVINRMDRGVESGGLFLFSYHLPNGFFRRKVKLEVQKGDSIYVILDDFFEPGEVLRALIMEGDKKEIHLYIDGEHELTTERHGI